jgi:hypothetical protein
MLIVSYSQEATFFQPHNRLCQSKEQDLTSALELSALTLRLDLDYENYSQESLVLRVLCSHPYTPYGIQPTTSPCSLFVPSVSCGDHTSITYFFEKQCGKVGKSMVSGAIRPTSVTY